MTDFRSLCAELVRIEDALRGGKQSIANQGQALDGYSALASFRALADRARAALAEQQPPTFLDAIRLAKGSHDYSGGYGGTPCDEAFHAGIGTVVNVLTKAATGPWDYQTIGVFEAGAPQPAADGEVATEPAAQSREPASVVEKPSDDAVECWADDQGFIRGYAEHPCGFWIDTGDIGKIARAVLARWGTAAPQPIPATERLPKAGDCDAEGRCWWFCFECPGEYSYWILAKEVYCNPTLWLPAHVLPLPTTTENNNDN